MEQVKEPTAMEVVLGIKEMLGRDPTREEIVAALGVPLVYKDSNHVADSFIAPYLAKTGRTRVDPLVEKVAPTSEDLLLGEFIACFTQWHCDRNLVDGATDKTQFVKLLEEVVELYMSICYEEGKSTYETCHDIQGMIYTMYTAGRIKPSNNPCILDDVGDIGVVLTNFLARREQTFGQAFEAAWHDIENRTGMMINGTYVKEADLSDGDKEEPRT